MRDDHQRTIDMRGQKATAQREGFRSHEIRNALERQDRQRELALLQEKARILFFMAFALGVIAVAQVVQTIEKLL